MIGADLCPLGGNLPFFKEGVAEKLFNDLCGEFAAADVVIAKADDMFAQHACEALNYELVLGTYIWSDPGEAADVTATRAFRILSGWPVAFAVVDLEQWWAVWGTWYQALAKKIAWSLVQRAKPEKKRSTPKTGSPCARWAIACSMTHWTMWRPCGSVRYGSAHRST